ncbi:MAG: PilN domain-containing protein [Nitrosomonadales bacterium]|nr:PilN domain-containing protein [Nitrosomonadales bacterium]
MMRINLLPHRAEKRRARQIQFIAFSVISVLLGAMLVGFVQVAIGTQISYQERRNTYLKDETAKLDAQIAEIKKLREETKALLERKDTVEKLQSDRSDAVHLLDQMLRILPEGVYLKSLKQSGKKINLVGYSQSNARVSTLMRAIDDSPWLESATLVVVSSTRVGNNRISEFTLNFSLSVKAVPAKPAAPKGKGA